MWICHETAVLSEGSNAGMVEQPCLIELQLFHQVIRTFLGGVSSSCGAVSGMPF